MATDSQDVFVPDELVYPAMNPSSPYVTTLCGLDLTSALGAEDPVDAVVTLLETVPAETTPQREELAAIIAGLRAGAAAANPATSPELFEALGLLRGRCSS